MIGSFLVAVVTVFILLIAEPMLLALARILGVYAIVEERQCRVYVLFGKVIATLDDPGLHFLWPRMGWKAPLVGWLGRCHVTDMRLDQAYLRSQPVNSEEGAPMGIGIWYEMYISDPVAYLFKNIDPRGSLAANVGNSTVRCLSNLPLEKMLVDRHTMSRTVRDEVTPKSDEWGYKLGSIYIRKVHFRDPEMIRQIESKVVNRLRQVTSAIRQDGANRVSIIRSTAERQAAIEFGKAAAVRPAIIGRAMAEISKDADVAQTMFEILETQRIVDGNGSVTLIQTPAHSLLPYLLASEGALPHEGISAGPQPPPKT
ncbi:MAG: SPFH/Band 7/PHB domain protein [Candidatus Hydrogenedentes bacterium]|nr:SPFH/Band 7/PHB domain protein [Candidatus Hydrogenedentota bacterium]